MRKFRFSSVSVELDYEHTASLLNIYSRLDSKYRGQSENYIHDQTLEDLY